MTQRLTFAVCFFLLGFSNGCKGLGNTLIASHPKTNIKTLGQPKLEALSGTNVAATATLAPLAELAATELVKAVGKAIEKEAQQYSATYSARLSDSLYTLESTQSAGLTETRSAHDIDGFRFTRPVRMTSDPTPAVVNGIEFEAKLDITDGREAIRVIPTKFNFSESRSKVAYASVWPWHWPSTVAWFFWQLSDSSMRKVDVNVQVALEVIGEDKDGNRKVVPVGTFDFPMGKQDVRAFPVTLDSTKLAHLASGWAPLPKVKDPASGNKSSLPINITVTVMEASDLGDVIAKGAEAFQKKEEEFKEKILSALGLSE